MNNEPDVRLIEECAELQKAICKARRFGWFNWHPDRPHELNLDAVLREMNDVVEAIEKVEVLIRQMKGEHFDSPAAKESRSE